MKVATLFYQSAQKSTILSQLKPRNTPKEKNYDLAKRQRST